MEHQPLRSTDVRDRNKKLILRLLFQNGTMSQSQVVQATGLKAPTVFRIFTKLEEERYIQPCDSPDDAPNVVDPERKGRRPAYYCVVPAAAYAVGVDFSTSGASVIVVDFVNQVIHHENQDFTPGIHRDDLLSRMGSMIDSGLAACHIDLQRLVGIGIGAPGVVNTETGVVVEYSRIDGLMGYSIKEHFSQRFSVPVFVHNNASIIAASEQHYNSAREYKGVLAVLVRGGVGAAFVNHGKIFLNGATTALELGRTSVCSAGDQTLESIAGEQPLLDLLSDAEPVGDWHEAQSRLPVSRIAELLAGPAGQLATAVRNLYHILHPDVVLVISRYEKLARVLTEAVGCAVPEVTAVPITYDPVKACYGATDLVFRHFFSDSGDFLSPTSVSG
jgi:predicted NBD/HSP70 family sugar kinase